jgi:two-component sensor histidine kinase
LISLVVSPIRGSDGSIIGASKIARDITERRRNRERQQLLLREMNHRIKNLFALAGSLVSLSARSATTPRELARSVRERLAALARAHGLTLMNPAEINPSENAATLHALIRVIVSPYETQTGCRADRLSIDGPDIALAAHMVSPLALIVHEFAANSAKYGSLSVPDGRVEIHCHETEDRFVLLWKERGGPPIEGPAGEEGFGTLLTRTTAKGQLKEEISREWATEGLTIRLSMDRARLTEYSQTLAALFANPCGYDRMGCQSVPSKWITSPLGNVSATTLTLPGSLISGKAVGVADLHEAL